MAASTKQDGEAGGAPAPREAAAAPAGSWRAFSRAALCTTIAATLLGLAVALALDPYWVFREAPPWLARTGGANRLLDQEMRRAKPLQLATRAPETVLVGSSTVYRGLDPADAGPGRVYNLGLSSLMAEELPVLAALIAAQPGIHHVVIGLDAFMFSDFAGPPPVDPDLATLAGRLRAKLGALLGLRGLVAVLAGTLRDVTEPGRWHRDGFKDTPAYPPAVTRRVAEEAAGRRLRFRPEALEALGLALERLRGREVRLFISPATRFEAALEERSGPGRAWREAVAALARRDHVVFDDLSDAHPFRDFAPETGSSELWLDHLHYRPEVGRWILSRLGRRAARS